MKRHQYRITIEPIAPAAPPPLQFQVDAHDEILALVERTPQRGDSHADTAAAFIVGLKLLGEVMLKNRSHPLFEEFGPQFGQFMQRLKGRKSETAGESA